MVDQIIRPWDLPDRSTPNPSEKIPVDNGSTVGGASVESIVLAGRPTASQAEAESGIDAVKAMTPLTTKQAVTVRIGVDIASKAQGDKADTAVQPGDLALVATTGDYDDLLNKPTISDETAAESRAWAIANLHPVTAPSYIRTAGYASPGDLGGALYRFVVAEPSHAGKFSITLDDGVSSAWYEISSVTLQPEMFGSIGINASGDTAAWVALASVANSRTSADINAQGRYLISGSSIVFDGTLNNLTLRLSNAEFFQQSNFSKTIRIENIPNALVRDGYFEGRGGGSGEYNGASSSYNGVAAIYFLNCDRVSVVGTRAYNHAGGSFAVFAGRVRHFENVTCEGIGYPFIDPIGQGNQGNGSDFAIMCQPTVNNSTQLFLFEDTFINCRLFDHAFGIQTVATKSLQMVGNEIGPCPGQHGVYGIENDGINIVGNIFRECRQMGFKMQFENYAGLYMGPAWAPSTSYAIGDVVTAFGVLWVCKTAHTSGGTFNSANWNIDPLWYREGGVIADNIFDLCGVGIGFISTTATNGRNMASIGQIISGNVIRDSNTTSGGMYLNRLNDALIEGNMIEGGSGPGIYGTDFSGSIKDNIIKGAAENGISISLSWQSWFEGNTIYDCGLSGTNDGNRAPILIFPVNADGQPDAAPAGKVVHIDCSNKIFYTTGDCPGAYLLYSTDSRINANIYETKGGATTKTISFAGTILAQWRNFWRKEGEGVFTPTVRLVLVLVLVSTLHRTLRLIMLLQKSQGR